MREQYVVFVDAGYVISQLRSLKSMTAPARIAEGLTAALREHALGEDASARLLRTYWYEGSERAAVANLSGVKVRLGRINEAGQQKGVDGLIILDLVRLAQQQAISTAYLVSGDDDLSEAVEFAQSFGVRVVVVGVGPRKSTSRHLANAADATLALPVPFWTEPAPGVDDRATASPTTSGSAAPATPAPSTPVAAATAAAATTPAARPAPDVLDPARVRFPDRLLPRLAEHHPDVTGLEDAARALTDLLTGRAGERLEVDRSGKRPHYWVRGEHIDLLLDGKHAVIGVFPAQTATPAREAGEAAEDGKDAAA